MLQSGSSKPTVLKANFISLALLAKSNHLISHNSGGLGLGKGGLDTTMLNQAAHEIGKQCGAMLRGATQFGFAMAVTHNACVAI